MNTNAVQETYNLLPADSVAYRCNPDSHGGRSKNPPLPAHLRWGEAINNREWGWRVVVTHHASGEPRPPTPSDPHIGRAYRYLQGARDDQMAMVHALKMSPNCLATRRVLQGLLCAQDISLEGIASLLELDADVVKLFAA